MTNRGSSPTSNSLSYEFYQVMVGDPRMDLHGWKQLAEWSLEHACLDHNQRSQAMGIFEEAWDDFCKWVVERYGEYADGLKDLL